MGVCVCARLIAQVSKPCISLDQKSLRKRWETVTQNIATKDYTTAFWQWFEKSKKCVHICADFIKIS
jgi:hypothetical protein